MIGIDISKQRPITSALLVTGYCFDISTSIDDSLTAKPGVEIIQKYLEDDATTYSIGYSPSLHILWTLDLCA